MASEQTPATTQEKPPPRNWCEIVVVKQHKVLCFHSDRRSPVPLGVLEPLDKVLRSPRLQVFAVVVGKGSLRVSLHGGQLDGFSQHRVFTE